MCSVTKRIPLQNVKWTLCKRYKTLVCFVTLYVMWHILTLLCFVCLRCVHLCYVATPFNLTFSSIWSLSSPYLSICYAPRNYFVYSYSFFWCSRYICIVNIAPLPSCFVLNPPSVGKASSNDNRRYTCMHQLSLSSPLHAILHFYAASLGKVISRVEMKTSVSFLKLLWKFVRFISQAPWKICFMQISVWRLNWRATFCKNFSQ